jgi:hypothetical protein
MNILPDSTPRRNPYPGQAESTTLSPEHRRMLEVDSGISPEVIAARGYWTATRLSGVPNCYPTWQKRVGLIVPMYSPDGETIRYQLRPDRRRYKGPKYETPTGSDYIVDVHPFSHDAIKDPSVTLWVTEGAKTGDALTSYKRCVAVLSGVHMFAVAGTEGRELLSCWDYIALKGRRVLVAYDADARTNADVQTALGRLVRALEARGAIVLVVYVPDVHGDLKAGVDDYLAAGGDLDELEATAAPYVPLDVARERLSRDEKLARIVAACWRRVHEMPARKRAECSRRAVMRDLIRTGERTGKVRPESLLVIRSSLDGAVGARMGERAWWKAIEGLEDAGELRRAKWGPGNDRPGAYILTPWGGGSAERAHYWREAPQRESQEREGENTGAQSFPLIHAPHDRIVHETRAPGGDSGEVPALRWPKVVHTWARREGRRVVVDSDYIARIGKQGEEFIRYFLEHGRSPTPELLAEFGSKTTRLRDFKRRRIAPLVDRGILVADGEDLSPDWREALERAREQTGELDDNRLQAERVARRKQERREHFQRVRKGQDTKADPTPMLHGKEHIREVLERNRPDWERRRVEDEREKVGVTAAVFVADELAGGGVRWRDMRERWTARGGRGEDLTRAVHSGPYRFGREADDWLYVYPSEAGAEPRPAIDQAEPATITPLHSEDPGGDWLEHPLDCECIRCSTPETRYATPRSAS